MTLCLLAGTSAFAQDRRAPRTKERPTAEQMAQRKTDRMVEKLNLNEDQSKQLYELNLQEVKDMQAQHERMRAARKAQAEKMQKILTPEQFEQWKQMQGPKPGMRPGPQMKDGKGCACKEAANNNFFTFSPNLSILPSPPLLYIRLSKHLFSQNR